MPSAPGRRHCSTASPLVTVAPGLIRALVYPRQVGFQSTFRPDAKHCVQLDQLSHKVHFDYSSFLVLDDSGLARQLVCARPDVCSG